MRIWSLLALIFVTGSALRAQTAPPSRATPSGSDAPVGIPYLDGLVVDGDLAEWTDVPAVRLFPGARHVEGLGPFSPDDLEVGVRFAWNATGVFVAATWSDDVLDVERLTRDDGHWVDPASGEARDRMYLFDNLAIRIVWEDHHLSVWTAPRVPKAHQWSTVRFGGPGTDSYVEDAQPSAIASKVDDGAIVLEIHLGWDVIQRPPPFFNAVELHVVAADSDLPGAAMNDRWDALSYLSWRRPIRLLPRP